MVARFVIAPEAEQDISEAYAWYESRQVGLGEEFLNCVDALWRARCVVPRCTQSFTRTIAEL